METDIALGKAAGMAAALVLTRTSSRVDRAMALYPLNYVLADLQVLLSGLVRVCRRVRHSMDVLLPACGGSTLPLRCAWSGAAAWSRRCCQGCVAFGSTFRHTRLVQLYTHLAPW